ncbi:N-6 DNA methylase [Xenorhabdus griffiniae]|uniref:N-6 DNA methylase n=1 Tax=Xenorhabdus griffiniae TaxID=351672 RepID=A0ABY9XF03_9GAMM|nr:N-6 DNA methylase [Xenorhabdus griffiniae]MBD1228748.1 N-6 DNA methylase [Xenorhabdus griffiniae]MBE8588669.1 N-6 DNA methylase [Xenorhabdus griffiniae]WMV71474.1 N-6 DNA methylase [Xenorhabdus griffiniae]WNH01151.1 N-6 DNA methylase [Xenorhabdus griffiniae]
MSSQPNHQKEFIALFNQTARDHRRYQVFQDFCNCAMAAVHNKYCYSEELEQYYLKTIKKYEREDVDRIVQLFSHVVLGLAQEPCDFLGSVFMQLGLGDKDLNQFFTPWSVASMMAEMQLQDVSARLQEKPFVTLYEPACGAGCMTLAAAEVLREQGHDPLCSLWVSAIDIDPLAAVMAYVQLSLAGIPAAVTIGNALDDGGSKRTRYTPAHYLGNWSQRLQAYEQAA